MCPKCREEYPEDTEFCPECQAPLCDQEDLDRVGVQYGSYEITGIIGVGGMGVVYKAQHTALLKLVAVKILNERYLHRKEAAREMLREAQAASRIRHPHIVDVTDFGTTPDGAPYFVMELLEGESLNELMNRLGRVPVGRAARLLRQVGGALAAAHSQGIIHRDLKPENIFLVDLTKQDRTQPGDFVKLLDFGLAKVLDMGPSSRTRAGMLAGTPWYMSPEQVQNKPVDSRSDIYSLGIVFYQMVTGTVPFTGESTVDILMSHVSSPVIQPYKYCKAIDEETNQVIMRCLEKNPDNRYQSMDEVCDAFERCGTTLQLESGEILPDMSEEKKKLSALAAPTITSELAGQVLGIPQQAGQPPPSIPTVDVDLVEQVIGPTAADDSELEIRSSREILDDAFSTGSVVQRLTPVGAAPPRSSARRWAPMAAVAGLVVLGLVGLGVFLTSTPDPKEVKPAIQPSPEPEVVRIDIAGLPAGARVYLDGNGMSVPMIVTRSEEPHRLAVEADGFLTHRQEIYLRNSQRLTIALKPDKPATAPKRKARRHRKRPRRRVVSKRRRRVKPKKPTSTKRTAKPKTPTKSKLRQKKQYKNWVIDPEI